MRVPGCNNHYKFVLSAGAPACPAYRQAGGRQESKNRDDLSRFLNKKAGNNLPILSVLGGAVYFVLIVVLIFNYINWLNDTSIDF